MNFKTFVLIIARYYYFSNNIVIVMLYFLLTKYHSGDQVKKTEMGGERSRYRGEEMCKENFGGET
jgi:hypothetical protein